MSSYHSHPQRQPNHRNGVLLIHGLTGSPLEMLPVQDHLSLQGYKTRLVTLPGHGERPNQHLFETSAIEILDHCAAEYEHFSREVDEVYIVGHSLGGICTLLTAAVRPPKLQGIVVFSAPYEHAYFYNYPQGLLRLSMSDLLKSLYHAPRDKFTCARPNLKPWNLPKLLKQSQVMFDLMKQEIHQIEVPVSLVHSMYDLVIPYGEMQKLAAVIGQAAPVKLTSLERSGHRIFPVSQDMDQAIQIIMDFLISDCVTLRANHSVGSLTSHGLTSRQ